MYLFTIRAGPLAPVNPLSWDLPQYSFAWGGLVRLSAHGCNQGKGWKQQDLKKNCVIGIQGFSNTQYIEY